MATKPNLFCVPRSYLSRNILPPTYIHVVFVGNIQAFLVWFNIVDAFSVGGHKHWSHSSEVSGITLGSKRHEVRFVSRIRGNQNILGEIIFKGNAFLLKQELFTGKNQFREIFPL